MKANVSLYLLHSKTEVYVIYLERLCNGRSAMTGKKEVLRKRGGAARSPRPPWASEPRLLAFEAAAKHLLSSSCVPGKGQPEDTRLRIGTTRAFFSNLSVQGSRWSPSHVTET